MTPLDQEIDKYLKEIKSWLPFPCKEISCILLPLQANIDSYTLEKPNATIAEIKSHFGAPEDIAAAYVSGISDMQLLKKRFMIQKNLKIVLLGVLIMLGIWLFEWLFFIILHVIKTGGFKPI